MSVQVALSWRGRIMSENEFEKQSQEWYEPDISAIISFDTFKEVIESTNELLDFLSDSVSIRPITNISKNKTNVLCGDFLLATARTLLSISACCRHGNFSDANMLIRKYRDDLFLYLYILESDNNEAGLTENELKELLGDGKDPDKLFDAVTITMGILSSGVRKNRHNQAVDAWFDNSAESGEYCRLLDINNYLRYLKSNTLVNDCIKKHKLEEPWNKLGRKQNNYIHNNGRSFLTDNNITIYCNWKRASILLEQIGKDISFITSFFLIILILIKADYISSNDYVDYLESGLTPPDNCQYWVAPIINEYISSFVVTLHPDLKKYLQENNPYGMLIE